MGLCSISEAHLHILEMVKSRRAYQTIELLSEITFIVIVLVMLTSDFACDYVTKLMNNYEISPPVS